MVSAESGDSTRPAEKVSAFSGRRSGLPDVFEMIETFRPVFGSIALLPRAVPVLNSSVRFSAGVVCPTGMVSPVYIGAQTKEAAAAQAAGKLPYTVGQIIDAPNEQIRKQMEAANAAAIKADPRLGTYQSISGGGRERTLIAEWENRNQGLKRIAPALYAQRLKEYKASIR